MTLFWFLLIIFVGWLLFHHIFKREGIEKVEIDRRKKQSNSNQTQKVDPTEAWGLIDKGILFLRSKPEKALEYFDEAIALDPECGGWWYLKGEALDEIAKQIILKEGRPTRETAQPYKELYKEQMECFEKAIKLDPKNAEAWYKKGLNLGAAERRHREALHCLNKAIELDPKHIDAWETKGFVLNALGKHGEATSCWEEASKLKNEEAQGYDFRDHEDAEDDEMFSPEDY